MPLIPNASWEIAQPAQVKSDECSAVPNSQMMLNLKTKFPVTRRDCPHKAISFACIFLCCNYFYELAEYDSG